MFGAEALGMWFEMRMRGAGEMGDGDSRGDDYGGSIGRGGETGDADVVWRVGE